jgi:hypothetical protein
MKMKRIVFPAVAMVLGLVAWSAVAQEQAEGAGVKTPEEPVVIPDYQPPASNDQIVIRGTEDATYYEYRVNGQLTEIKVVPEAGKPYYLVPADGGGWIREDRSGMLVPSWVLFKW